MPTTRTPRKSTLRIAAYLILAIAGIFGLWRVESTADDAQTAVDEVAEEQDERTIAICEATNQNRKIILQLVEVTSQSGTDFTQVPGWEELDPATQNFLLNVNSNRNGESQFIEAARRLLAPEDCEELVEKEDS